MVLSVLRPGISSLPITIGLPILDASPPEVHSNLKAGCVRVRVKGHHSADLVAAPLQQNAVAEQRPAHTNVDQGSHLKAVQELPKSLRHAIPPGVTEHYIWAWDWLREVGGTRWHGLASIIAAILAVTVIAVTSDRPARHARNRFAQLGKPTEINADGSEAIVDTMRASIPSQGLQRRLGTVQCNQLLASGDPRERERALTAECVPHDVVRPNIS
mmetsp:Transcript_29659/g.39889  ORF Transcript_29659/g.39889 Transcript_29659/m.39889 type:complete len:215 (+) Transcript_29659:48-692(+)